MRSLPNGEPLTLVREPTNTYDPNAVQVWACNEHVGYIKATEVRPLAAFIDQHGRPWVKPVAVSATPLFEPPAAIEMFRAISAKLVARQWPQVEVEQ